VNRLPLSVEKKVLTDHRQVINPFSRQLIPVLAGSPAFKNPYALKARPYTVAALSTLSLQLRQIFKDHETLNFGCNQKKSTKINLGTF